MTYLAGGHRIGYDMTISAPLDVSVAFALASDPQNKKPSTLRTATRSRGRWKPSKPCPKLAATRPARMSSGLMG